MRHDELEALLDARGHGGRRLEAVPKGLVDELDRDVPRPALSPAARFQS